MTESPDEHVELVSTEPVIVVKDLKKAAGKDIWRCGGADLATALFPEIDELILKINPVLIGSGIPLFSGPVNDAPLRLSNTKAYSNGFVLSSYRVQD